MRDVRQIYFKNVWFLSVKKTRVNHSMSQYSLILQVNDSSKAYKKY